MTAANQHGYVLPDVLAPGLDLVFCGTAPSRISFSRRIYYANPGNAFWPTLRKVGLLPEGFDPARFADLPMHGLGLTDLNKTEWGSDHDLSLQHFDVEGLRRKLVRYRPAAVAFTSKTAAAHWFGARNLVHGAVPDETVSLLRPPALRSIAWFVLPSPSGRAKSWWQAGPWEEVAAFVATRRTARDAGSEARR